MTSRPVVSVYKSDNAKEIADSVATQPYSPPQSETISFILFTRTLPKIEDKVTPFSTKQVLNTPPNPGVQEEPSLVFQESQVLVPPELVKPLLVTCAERLECLLPSRSGENGTLRSTSSKEELP